MDQCSVSFSCITAFPWCNWNRQQYRLSHSRCTQPSGADTVTHWYLLAAKQPQENFSSSSSPSDSSSHPHNSYLSSRVAISTTISKLLPSVPYSPTFLSNFSLQQISSSSLPSPWIFIFQPLFYTHFIQLQCSALLLFPAFCTGLYLLFLSCLSMHSKSESASVFTWKDSALL